MAVDPLIYQYEQKYRSSLVAGDSNSRKALLKAYSGTFKSLQQKIGAMTSKIQAARDAGELISASWIMQQKQYRDLQMQVAQQMGTLATALGQNLPADQMAAVKAAEVFVGTESGPVFNKLPAAAVEGVVGTTTSGSPLRNLLDSFNVNGTDDASRFVRSRLIAGVAAGTAPQLLAQQLAGGIESLALSRALTISRTETLRAYRRATTLSIAANKDLIAGWVWRSAADERTCAACFSLHGTFFPGATPMRAHPNCRCVMLPKRIMKNDPHGFGTSVQVGNGADLFKALPESSQLKILGRGKFELYKSGKITLNQTRTLRANPIWGPSYQVKSLKAIKADLDNPPPVKPPKPTAPKKPLEPTGALPSPSVVDEVSVAESAASVAPKPVPVAPKATAVQKAEQKVAAQESKLLSSADADYRVQQSIPTVSPEDAIKWRNGEILHEQDIVFVDMKLSEEIGHWIGSTNQRMSIRKSYVQDEQGWWYNSAQAGGGETWAVIRTAKEYRIPYTTTAPWLDPAFRLKTYRAIGSRATADMKLVIVRPALEKALANAKIDLERMLNPELYQKRAAGGRAAAKAPAEITDEQLTAALQESVDTKAAMDALNTHYRADNPYLSWNQVVNATDEFEGYVPAKVLAESGAPMSLYQGVQVWGDYALQRSGLQISLETAQALGRSDLYADVLWTVTKLKPGMGPRVSEIVYNSSMQGGIGWSRLSSGWFETAAVPQRFVTGLQSREAALRQYSQWKEYEQLRAMAGKKGPVKEVSVGVDGVSAPIPASSAFSGKTRKWTTREDANAARAKDQVSFEISERLAKDDAFIKDLAANDNLPDWLNDAGRSARPGVKEAMARWKGWNPELRERWLRSGEIEQGYYEWSPYVDYVTQKTTYRRGAWHNSVQTEGRQMIYDYASQMVQQWAGTSGDAHILSVAMQRAAMEEFSLSASTTLAHFEGRLHSGGFGVPRGDLLPSVEAFYTTNGVSIRRFLRAMYEQTQDELALAGITTVRAIRGVGSIPRAAQAEWSASGLESLGIGESRAGLVDLQPMSSFAVDTKTAKNFGGTLIYVDVPASWVLGTCRTGFGCLNEYEWVILGGPMKATVFNGRRW